MTRTRSRHVLYLLLTGTAACGLMALSTHHARAFFSPIPGCTYYPCPVFDAVHNSYASARVPINQQKNVAADKKRQCDQARLQTIGKSGSTGQGTIPSGSDLTGGQTLGQTASSVSSVLGAATQFYFADQSNFQNQTISGPQNSNFTQAAQSSSTTDVAATIFALQAMQQIQKDSQQVKQLVQQASTTQNLRQDLGFANKVRAMVVQELQLRNALQAQINLVKSKRIAFSMLADQTQDQSSGSLLNGTSASSLLNPTGSQSTSTPSATTTTTPASGLKDAVTGPQFFRISDTGAKPADMDRLVRNALAEKLAETLPGQIPDPSVTANKLADAFDQYHGDLVDRLRQLSLRISDNPAAFGLSHLQAQDGVLDAMIAYAQNKGGAR